MFVGSVLKYTVFTVVIVLVIVLTWLRWESHLPRDDWFDESHGQVDGEIIDNSITADGQLSTFVTLHSDTGLSFSFRVIRYPTDEPLPVLLVLGGHRTGSDAVDLFGNVGERAVVAMDYPYDGPERVRGLGPVLQGWQTGQFEFRGLRGTAYGNGPAWRSCSTRAR